MGGAVTSQNGLTVYAFPISQPSRSIYMLLKAENIPYKSVVINILAGEQKSREYLTVNPAGLVPALVDGDLRLGEGAAILQYLAESRNLVVWYPKDPILRAKVNYWLHWHHSNTRNSTTKIFGRLLRESLTVDVSEAKENFYKSIAFLNDHLSSNKFVGGGASPSIADLMLIPEIDQLEFIPGLIDYSPYPNVVRYIGDLKTTVSSYEEVASVARNLVAAHLAGS